MVSQRKKIKKSFKKNLKKGIGFFNRRGGKKILTMSGTRIAGIGGVLVGSALTMMILFAFGLIVPVEYNPIIIREGPDTTTTPTTPETGDALDYYQLALRFDLGIEFLLAVGGGDMVYPPERVSVYLYFYGLPFPFETMNFYFDGDTYYSRYDYPESVEHGLFGNYFMLHGEIGDIGFADSFQFGDFGAIGPYHVGTSEDIEIYYWNGEFGGYMTNLRDFVHMSWIKDGSGMRFDVEAFIEG